MGEGGCGEVKRAIQGLHGKDFGKSRIFSLCTEAILSLVLKYLEAFIII
jgi:hypothetical protein